MINEWSGISEIGLTGAGTQHTPAILSGNRHGYPIKNGDFPIKNGDFQ